MNLRPQSILIATLVASLTATAVEPGKQVVRWTEGQPECAFRADQDGIYRYTLVTSNAAITLAMDSRELDDARQRIEPLLALFVGIRFLSRPSTKFNPATVTLEFAKHFHEKETPLEPELLAHKLVADRQAATDQAAASIRKRPAQKNELEAELNDEQRSIDRMIAFLHAKMLFSAPAENGEQAGWLLFSTRNRWIGQLNQQEEFILRVPVGEIVAEFPFNLPPSRRDIELRTRPPE